MNLGKIFNFNFFIQNIKKSKSAVIFFVALVLLFNIITTMVIGANTQYNALGKETVVTKLLNISIVNIVSMYVFPIVLSCILFGFVFKKSSVDYINSMPISRKTLFITNTVGGIGIIVITMLLNTLSIGVMSSIYSNVYTSVSMLCDYFMLWTITYIFVFIVANLAMSVSGNVQTQIVVVALILFFIPFISHFSTYLSGRVYNVELYNALNNKAGVMTNENNICTYTLPYNILAILTETNTTNEKNIFNIVSIIKMVVLSVVYFIIGIALYQRRKMEVNEISFKSMHWHNIVKCLTLVPIIFIASELLLNVNELVTYIFFIALIIAYYYIYDLITRKQITRIKLSLIYLVGAIIVILFFRFVVVGNWRSNKVYENNVVAIKMNTDDGIYEYTDDDNNGFVEDKELISQAISHIVRNDVVFEAKTSSYVSENEGYMYVTVNIKTKNEKRYSFSTKWSQAEYTNMLEQYKKSVDTKIDIKNDDKYFAITIDKIILRDMTKEQVLEEVINSLKNVTKDTIVNNNVAYIKLYRYENHELKEYVLPINISKTLEQYIMSENNKLFVANLHYFTDMYISNNYREIRLDTITTFIKEHANDVVDSSKPLAKIYASNYDYKKRESIRYCYYTNSVEQLFGNKEYFVEYETGE